MPRERRYLIRERQHHRRARALAMAQAHLEHRHEAQVSEDRGVREGAAMAGHEVPRHGRGEPDGDEGLDELSIGGPSTLATIGFALPSGTVTPEAAGLPRHPLASLRGGDATGNAAALRRLLIGEPSAYRDAVLLNSAAALIVAGEVDDWRAGVEEAAEVIDKGLAKALLDCWIATVK